MGFLFFIARRLWAGRPEGWAGITAEKGVDIWKRDHFTERGKTYEAAASDYHGAN